MALAENAIDKLKNSIYKNAEDPRISKTKDSMLNHLVVGQGMQSLPPINQHVCSSPCIDAVCMHDTYLIILQGIFIIESCSIFNCA